MTIVKELQERVTELEQQATEHAKKINFSQFSQTARKLVETIQVDLKKNLDDKEYDKYGAAISNIDFLRTIEKELWYDLWLTWLQLQAIAKDLVQKLVIILESSNKKFTSFASDIYSKEIDEWHDTVSKYKEYDDLMNALEIFINAKNSWWKSQPNLKERWIIDEFIQKVRKNILEKTVDGMEKYEILTSKKMVKFLTDCLRDNTYGGNVLPFLKELLENKEE